MDPGEWVQWVDAASGSQTVLGNGAIEAEDLDLFHIVDEPDDVCEIISQRYKNRVTSIHEDRRERSKRGV